jgi:hypothetical protein
MSDNPIATPVAPVEQQPKKKKRGRREAERKIIHLSNGEEAWPRPMIAEKFDICEASVRRWDLPTLYFGGVAYHPYNASMKAIAAKARSRSPR